jgi:hypothetical protein
MLFLAKNQANTPDLLQLFHTGSDGFLVDAAEVGYQVANSSGTQIFPAVPTAWEEVTTTGKEGTGRYYAWDSATGLGYASGTAGTYRIDWHWKAEAGDDYETWSQWFRVEEVSLPYYPQFETYLSIQDFRDFTGVVVGTLANDVVARLIYHWQQYIDERCGQTFRPQYSELILNGNGSKLLQLQAAILGIESIYMNNASSESSSTAFDVYFDDVIRRTMIPKRAAKNPRILIKRSSTSTSIWARPDETESRFADGLKQTVSGVWGYRDPGNVCPAPIIEALIELLRVHGAGYGADGLDAAAGTPGPITQERTDIHSISYGSGGTSESALASGSARVEQILRMYRRPISLG